MQIVLGGVALPSISIRLGVDIEKAYQLVLIDRRL